MKMKKSANKLLCLSLAVISAFSLSGCVNYLDEPYESFAAESTVSISETKEAAVETTSQISETEPSETTEETSQQITVKSETAAPPETTSAKTEKTTVTEITTEKLSVEKDGSYTSPEDVAEYIHTFGTLPKNFITKDEAKALGWDNKKGNLWDIAEGKSIGGDYFGNYEGLLPKAKGRKYTECDVNYEGGYRGSERIIFSNDGLIYYTNDHYQTFTQLY